MRRRAIGHGNHLGLEHLELEHLELEHLKLEHLELEPAMVRIGAIASTTSPGKQNVPPFRGGTWEPF
jgi:hypothetical protein